MEGNAEEILDDVLERSYELEREFIERKRKRERSAPKYDFSNLGIEDVPREAEIMDFPGVGEGNKEEEQKQEKEQFLMDSPKPGEYKPKTPYQKPRPAVEKPVPRKPEPKKMSGRGVMNGVMGFLAVACLSGVVGYEYGIIERLERELQEKGKQIMILKESQSRNQSAEENRIIEPQAGLTIDSTIEFDSCRPVPQNKDLSVILSEPCLSPRLIDQILRENSSPAAGTGQLFYDLGEKYGIDTAVALAFFKVESTFGKHGAAEHTKSIGNIRPGGSWTGDEYYTGSNGTFRKYSTWEEGIRDWFKLIRNSRYYVAGGNITVESIVPKYAPRRDNNNPQKYIRDVRNYVDELRKRALQDKQKQINNLSINRPMPVSLINLYTNQELHENEAVLVVDKSNYMIQLWQYKRDELNLIGEYDISIGSGGLGPKERLGDGTTPEGDYIITIENHHKYGWPTFRLNYPNPADLALKRTGKGILIHTTGYHNLGKRRTLGCIGMSRKSLENLLQKGVDDGTKLLIRPHLTYFSSDIEVSRK